MSRQDRVAVYVCITVLTALLFATMIRNETWRSEFTLWSDVQEKSPDSPIGYFGVAREYHRNGNGQAAFDAYQMAMGLAAMRTDFRSRDILALAQANMGALLIATGKPEDRKLGIMALQASMSLYPYYGPSVMWLSQALNEDEKYNEAIDLIDAAVAHGFGGMFVPQSGPLYINKALALCALGFDEKANEYFNYAARFADIPPGECRPSGGF